LEREIQKLKVLGLKKKSLMPEERSLDVHSFYPVRRPLPFRLGVKLIEDFKYPSERVGYKAPSF
jgi:hypothetical protein